MSYTRPFSQQKQSKGTLNSTKKDEDDQKLPNIKQPSQNISRLSSNYQNKNKNYAQKRAHQDNQTLNRPLSRQSITTKDKASLINQEEQINKINSLQEEKKESQNKIIASKPITKNFLQVNKNNPTSKKISNQAPQTQASRVDVNQQNYKINQKQQLDDLESNFLNKSQALKPREFKFHTNTRIEHRKEMNIMKAKQNIILDRVNYHIQRIILCFAASSYQEVYKLMKVCKKFYQVITSHYRIWECVLTTLTKPQQIEFLKRFPTFEDMQENQKIKIIREYVEVEEKKNVIKLYEKYFTDYRKLFEYCSTKENLPNKLLQRLKLKVSATINKFKISEKKYLLRCENFSSHLLIKFDEIQKINLQYLDAINFEISFFSLHLKTSVKIARMFKVKDIFERSVCQKAFCYYEERNFLTCFFEGDSIFLYTLFEISAIELVTRFRLELEKRLIYEEKKKLGVKTPKQQMKFLQRDMSDYQYDSFSDYFKYQLDFEVMINVHNSLKKNLYTFIDTRSFPITQTESQAQFIFSPGDRFFIENVFSLDNKSGMKESVKDILLLDLILKDRDRFLICYSGYVRIQDINELSQKNNVDMNFDYSTADEYQAKKIYFNEPNQYSFELLIIQTKREAILKSINITINQQIISGNLPLEI
ncbi:hypothetical protein ABPG72_003181 [Tetrahymena utriculariae]